MTSRSERKAEAQGTLLEESLQGSIGPNVPGATRRERIADSWFQVRSGNMSGLRGELRGEGGRRWMIDNKTFI